MEITRLSPPLLVRCRYWAWAMSHLCVFDSKTSQIAQAMFTGAFIHGAALFGVENIFYNSAEEDSLLKQPLVTTIARLKESRICWVRCWGTVIILSP